jgi:hypothetical protein
MSGTKINYDEFGFIRKTGNRLLCADGKVRAAELAKVADTWFSIPASVRINGVRVRGYASVDKDKAVFRPYTAEIKKAPFLDWRPCK